jgi:hypothetical protein
MIRYALCKHKINYALCRHKINVQAQGQLCLAQDQVCLVQASDQLCFAQVQRIFSWGRILKNQPSGCPLDRATGAVEGIPKSYGIETPSLRAAQAPKSMVCVEQFHLAMVALKLSGMCDQ